jgi:outer membrane protein TolC
MLRAKNRLVLARMSVDRQLDAFKITLGLPTDLKLELDENEIGNMARLIKAEAEDPATMKGPDEEAVLKPALENRLDLKVTRMRFEDARRKVKVAADALRAGLDLKLSASSQERRYSGTDTEDLNFSDGRFGLVAEMDLPWERTAERNAYRQQLLAVDAAERSLELKEDSVMQEVRNALRELQAAIESYHIQVVAVELAERRVKSTDLFLEAGRAQIRDVLDSEESLVSARNALSQSMVSIRMARLELLRDTETLEIDSRGIWSEKQ